MTNRSGVSFWGDVNVLNCGGGYNTVKILKATELYTLNETIIRSVNYISIKLFF